MPEKRVGLGCFGASSHLLEGDGNRWRVDGTVWLDFIRISAAGPRPGSLCAPLGEDVGRLGSGLKSWANEPDLVYPSPLCSVGSRIEPKEGLVGFLGRFVLTSKTLKEEELLL